MGKKKKHSQKTAAPQQKKVRTLDDYSLEQLITMPTDKVIELMMNDPSNKDFVYPYRIVMEVYTFIGKYKAHQAKCLQNLMTDLANSGVMNGSTFTMDKRATTVIKATAKTASFKQLDTFHSQAEEMLHKLDNAQELMEEAFKNHPEMDDYRKNVLRNVILDVRMLLKQEFHFLTHEETNVNE